MKNSLLLTGQRTSYAGSSGSSSTSTRISTAHITKVLEKLKNNQTRNSTLQNYLSIWRNLNKFLLNLDGKVTGSWNKNCTIWCLLSG